MIPRLKSSKKWTGFPGDFNNQIKEAFLESFGEQLEGQTLVVEGRIYQSEILLRVGFAKDKELSQHNFEVSMDYVKDQAIDRIHDAIDVAASLVADYFENHGEAEFPREWYEIQFEQVKAWIQYTTVNTRLEDEANRLLGETGGGLVQEEDFDEPGEADPSGKPRDPRKLH